MKLHVNFNNILLASLFITLLSGCNETEITKTLKEYKIISSIEDRDFLPNQIKKTFDWGFIIRDDRLYKIANKEGKILTQSGFKWMPKFSDKGIAIVQNSESKYGLIDTKGEYLLETIYDKITDFNKFGLAIISRNNPYTTKSGHTSSRRTQGLIDIYGKFKIEPEYFNITYLEDLEIYIIDHHSYQQSRSPLKKSLYSVSKGWVENATYDSIGKFKKGLAIVRKDKKSGIINKDGEVIIPPIYEYVFEETEGLISVSKDKLTAFFDTQGNIVIPFKDNRAGSFNHGVSIIYSKTSNRSYPELALMNKNGNTITDYEFSTIRPFTYYEDIDKTLAFAKPLKGRFGGLIDTAGNYVVKPKFSDIKIDKNSYFNASYYVFNKKSSTQTLNYLIDASENLYIDIDHKNPDVSKPETLGKIGLLNRNRQVITEPVYDDAIALYSNTIKVKKGLYWGVVNNKNDILLPIEFQKIDVISPRIAFVKANNMWGVHDIKNGKMSVPMEYQEIEILSLNKIRALKKNKWETINL
jgi:hypothetical protein